MIRKTVKILSFLALLTLADLSWLVYQASPGPSNQVILGVTLGQFHSERGVAFLSGRRLDCTSSAEPPYTDTCTVVIAGQPLTIQAFRHGPDHPNQLGGGCTAAYAGQIWPCEISSRHVHVHWFARIQEPLGLDAVQMTALRQKYFFENLAEEPVVTGTLAFPILIMMTVFTGFLAWWPRPLPKRAWITAVGLGLFSLVSSFLVAFKLTNGFWD